MRICISGATHMGKSTLVKDFVKAWPNYKEIKLSYRDKLKEKFDPEVDTTDIMRLIKVGGKETQEMIRDSIIDDISKYTREDNVIYDRGLMDNLVYSLYLCGMDVEGCDGEWMKSQLPILSEAFKFYDIIFFTPLLKGYTTPAIPEGSIELDRDVVFRSECDNIFKALQQEYLDGKRNWLPAKDTPAIIEAFGSPEERIQIMKLYLTEDGVPYGEDNSLIQEHLKEGLDLMEHFKES